MADFDLFSKLLKINPTAGKFVTIGLIVLTAAAIVVNFGQETDTLIRTGVIIVAFSVLVLVLVNIPGPVIRLVGWFVTLAFCLWSSALLAQTLSGNKIAWLAPTQCLLYPLSESCAITQTTTTEPPILPAENMYPESAGDGAESDPEPEPPALPPPPQAEKVFVQFAGSISRDSVVEYSQTLVADGWQIEGAERGGERTGLAAGLNEVRYFHAEDRAAAEFLALRTTDLSPAGHEVSVRDLSKTRFSSTANKGVLEVWISN